MKKTLFMLTALSIACPCHAIFAADDDAQLDQPQEQVQEQTQAEKDAQDRFEFMTIFGNRYDHKSDQGVTDKSSVVHLITNFRFNEYFTGVTHSELHQWWGDDVDTSGMPEDVAENYDENWRDWFLEAYVGGKYNMVSGKAGRFTYIPAYGIVHGLYQQVTGGLFSLNYNDRFSITGVAGKNCYHEGPLQKQDNTDYYSADFTANILPIVNVKGAFMSDDDGDDDTKYYEAGFDVKLPLNFTTEAAYIKSDADDDDTGYYAQIKYGQANPFVRNTFDIYLQYHDLEANSIMGNDIPLEADVKGIRAGVRYVPLNNVQIWAFYDDGEVISTGENEDFFRLQVDFFFDWKV